MSCTRELHLRVQEQLFISWLQVFCGGDTDTLAIHSLLRMRMGSCIDRKPRDALQTVRWDSLTPEMKPIPRKPASMPRVPTLCRPCYGYTSACHTAAKTPREGKLRAAGMAAISHRHVASHLHVAHGHQTKHSTGQSLRTDSSRGHPPAAAPLTATHSEPHSPAPHPATGEQTFPSGQKFLIPISKGFLTWIGTRKGKLRSKHNYEEN